MKAFSLARSVSACIMLGLGELHTCAAITANPEPLERLLCQGQSSRRRQRYGDGWRLIHA